MAANDFYSRVGGRHDGYGIDLFRAQNDAEKLVMSGAKRVGFHTTTGRTLEWLDPFLGFICVINERDKGFIQITVLADHYMAVDDQWVIE